MNGQHGFFIYFPLVERERKCVDKEGGESRQRQDKKEKQD